MARIEANLAGADEALMLNDAGNVAECTADNVFIIKTRADFYAADCGRRVARDHPLGRFRYRGGTGIKISETDITRHDVFIADECFLTGTAAELIPVIKADGRSIGTGKPGPITARMIERFRELTRETGTPIFS